MHKLDSLAYWPLLVLLYWARVFPKREILHSPRTCERGEGWRGDECCRMDVVTNHIRCKVLVLHSLLLIMNSNQTTLTLK